MYKYMCGCVYVYEYMCAHDHCYLFNLLYFLIMYVIIYIHTWKCVFQKLAVHLYFGLFCQLVSQAHLVLSPKLCVNDLYV